MDFQLGDLNNLDVGTMAMPISVESGQPKAEAVTPEYLLEIIQGALQYGEQMMRAIAEERLAQYDRGCSPGYLSSLLIIISKGSTLPEVINASFGRTLSDPQTRGFCLH